MVFFHDLCLIMFNAPYSIVEQITDAVVAAYILNVTLIVPMLDQKSYWKDARFVQQTIIQSS